MEELLHLPLDPSQVTFFTSPLLFSGTVIFFRRSCLSFMGRQSCSLCPILRGPLLWPCPHSVSAPFLGSFCTPLSPFLHFLFTFQPIPFWHRSPLLNWSYSRQGLQRPLRGRFGEASLPPPTPVLSGFPPASLAAPPPSPLWAPLPLSYC